MARSLHGSAARGRADAGRHGFQGGGGGGETEDAFACVNGPFASGVSCDAWAVLALTARASDVAFLVDESGHGGGF